MVSDKKHMIDIFCIDFSIQIVLVLQANFK